MKQKSAKSIYYVYILLCRNNSYYTGYTHDVDKRFEAHVKGTAKCKYTHSFKPICIAQQWQFEDKSQAMRAEYYIKTLSKKQKQAIILKPQLLWEMLH